MPRRRPPNHSLLLVITGLAAWVIPGAGHFIINEKKRALIIFPATIITFCIGIYIGSIGVVDPVGAKLAYAGQIMVSPAIAILGYFTAGGGFTVYGRPFEIGQIYTLTAGLLNFLCIVNAVYFAHLRQSEDN